MITLQADLHTHTLASGHAFATVNEMAEGAEKKKLNLIALTDHGKGMEGAPSDIYFVNLVCLPRQVGNVTLLRGIEANVMDTEGHLDVPDKILQKLEWIIASLHSNVIAPSTEEEHTKTYLRLAENPLVDMIGHADTPAFSFDYDRVIPILGANGKIIEINNHHAFRLGEAYTKNARRIAELCMQHGVNIAVNSDAHTSQDVGEVGPALRMLEEIQFPRSLIINETKDKVLSHIQSKRSFKS